MKGALQKLSIMVEVQVVVEAQYVAEAEVVAEGELPVKVGKVQLMMMKNRRIQQMNSGKKPNGYLKIYPLLEFPVLLHQLLNWKKMIL